MQLIWSKIRESDEVLSREAPWKMMDKEKIAIILKPIAQTILNLAFLLEAFIPESAKKIQTTFLEP